VARRLSPGTVVQGQARALDGGAASAPVSEDVEEYRFGFDRGYTDGLRQARLELEAAAEQARTEWEQQARQVMEASQAVLQGERDQVTSLAGKLADALVEDRRWAESMAVELAHAAILHVFGDKAMDRSLVAELCARARRDVGHDVVSVSVAPDDVAAVQSLVGGVPVTGDDALPPGSCVLHSQRGRFDAGLEMRMDQLRDALLTALRAEGTDA
jgi:flagellar biosynthesis/type III secretory pathway protein FliH